MQYSQGPGNPVTTSLGWAVGAWNQVEASGSRQFLKRIQRALHDEQPVVMMWRLDLNALEGSGKRRGSFNKTTYDQNGPGSPGRQGIHLTVAEDYQAVLADNTVLPAGRDATAAQLQQALETSTRIQFFRTKNSWGTGSYPSPPGKDGYTDLYLDYLTGPVGGRQAFMFVVLPPGY